MINDEADTDKMEMSDVVVDQEDDLDEQSERRPRSLVITLRYLKGRSPVRSKVNAADATTKGQDSFSMAPTASQSQTAYPTLATTSNSTGVEEYAKVTAPTSPSIPDKRRRQMPEYAFCAPVHSTAPSPLASNLKTLDSDQLVSNQPRSPPPGNQRSLPFAAPNQDLQANVPTAAKTPLPHAQQRS